MTQYMQEAGAMKQADEQREALEHELFRIAMYGDRGNSQGTKERISAALAAALPPAAVQAQPSDRELYLAQQAVVGNAWRMVALRVAFNKFKTLPPPEAYEWAPQQLCDWMMNEGALTAGKQGGDGVPEVVMGLDEVLSAYGEASDSTFNAELLASYITRFPHFRDQLNRYAFVQLSSVRATPMDSEPTK